MRILEVEHIYIGIVPIWHASGNEGVMVQQYY
jgi:hypothetical protein